MNDMKSRIIPAIDVIEGKVVRLEEGDYGRTKVYKTDPVDAAKSFEDHGIQFLHVVDLEGAKEGKVVNWKTLEMLANQTTLVIDFGGGIKSDEDVRIAFESGAAQINVGSLAAKQRDTFLRWLGELGKEKVILSADAKNEKIAIHGWQDTTELFVYDYIGQYAEEGVQYVTCTDISKDGMLRGPNLDLYKRLLGEIEGIKLIASGGVSNAGDIESLMKIGVDGIIIGKAIYEGRLTLKELQGFAT